MTRDSRHRHDTAHIGHVPASQLGGLTWKSAVRVATTANGTLATAYENGDTIDGVTLATGDRILLKNQTTGSQNGVYIVQASGAPFRAEDFDAADEVRGSLVYVQEGTVNAGTVWRNTNASAVTIGSTSLTFMEWPRVGDLADVDLTGLADGEALTYENASGLWKPAPAGGGSVPSGTDPGDLLVWDGAAWDILPVGLDDEVLIADSAELLGVKWGAAGGGGGDTYLYVPSDTSISSAGFVDIPGLTFAVTNGQVYAFEAFIGYRTTSATMGVLFGFNRPAVTSFAARTRKQITAGGTASTDMFSEAVTTLVDTPLPNSTDEPAAFATHIWEITGYIIPSADGTFALRWSKENVAGTAIVAGGSWLRYRDIT